MPIQAPQYTQNVQEQFSSGVPSIGWPKKFFTFALVLFLASFFFYAGLAFGYKTFLNKAIGESTAELDGLSDRVSSEEKDNLAMLHSQLTNIRSLLGSHVFSSQGLVLLESITHPNVSYIGLDLTTDKGEISIEGIALSYEDLVAQLTILENSEFVESYNLENSQWESGGIQFRINMVVTEKVFDLIQ
ncbi:hypothetical protein KKH05_03150 [Patescibacteria group bacterium]|nr:hypothetical protein [Patescibacteria group bacterium]